MHPRLQGPCGPRRKRVYTVHDWAEVRRLHEREHLSKKHIAERLDMSRTTVHRLLELAEPPR